MNYAKFMDIGDKKISVKEEYSSDNAQQLNIEELKQLLLKLKIMKFAMRGELIDSEG